MLDLHLSVAIHLGILGARDTIWWSEPRVERVLRVCDQVSVPSPRGSNFSVKGKETPTTRRAVPATGALSWLHKTYFYVKTVKHDTCSWTLTFTLLCSACFGSSAAVHSEAKSRHCNCSSGHAPCERCRGRGRGGTSSRCSQRQGDSVLRAKQILLVLLLSDHCSLICKLLNPQRP